MALGAGYEGLKNTIIINIDPGLFFMGDEDGGEGGGRRGAWIGSQGLLT
jgi:hypothetical protein